MLTDDSLCCVRLQGPALYLFNDATFSKEDFANIARIGQASKLDKVGHVGRVDCQPRRRFAR